MTEIEIENLVQNIDISESYIFFVCPNYEDRSLAFIDEVIKLHDHHVKLGRQPNFTVIILKLQSKNYKIDLLDDIKINSFNSCEKKLSDKKIKKHTEEIAYPDRYSISTVKYIKENYVQSKDCVIFDFSCLPKKVIADICEIFFQSTVCKKFSFAYTSPESYPRIRHPQAIGDMKGILKYKPIHNLIKNSKKGVLMNFPSDLGYSGQLISDQLAKYSHFEQYLFVYMRRRSPLQSYNAMSGNMNLIEEGYKEWRNNVINHFTIQDGYRKLKDILGNIVSRAKEEGSTEYLVLMAPFGPKPLIVGCFILAKALEKKGITAEIVQESSFQYSSVYSIGVDKTYLFEVDEMSRNFEIFN